jgi:hypothetical protein
MGHTCKRGDPTPHLYFFGFLRAFLALFLTTFFFAGIRISFHDVIKDSSTPERNNFRMEPELKTDLSGTGPDLHSTGVVR